MGGKAMTVEISDELIAKKKKEIIEFLTSNFDVSAFAGAKSKYQPYDVVNNEKIQSYRESNYLYNHNARHIKNSLNWLENPTVWIRLISVDEQNRGKGLAIHIKCQVDNWTGGRSTVHKQYYKKWKLPFERKNIHLRIAHGNELIYSVLHDEVEKFNPNESYFKDFLNHSFDLYIKNVLNTKRNTNESAKETDVLRRNPKLKPNYTKNNGYESQRLNGKKVYLNNKLQDDELEFQEKVQDLPNPPRGIKINYVPKEKKRKATNRAFRVERRNATVAKNAVASAYYLCEIDSEHPHFKSKKSNENYVEAHHLIPIYATDEFEKSIDVEANVVSLCPNCHRKLHHAEFLEVKPLLEKLYLKLKNDLETCEIGLTFEHLISYYQ